MYIDFGLILGLLGLSILFSKSPFRFKSGIRLPIPKSKILGIIVFLNGLLFFISKRVDNFFISVLFAVSLISLPIVLVWGFLSATSIGNLPSADQAKYYNKKKKSIIGRYTNLILDRGGEFGSYILLVIIIILIVLILSLIEYLNIQLY